MSKTKPTVLESFKLAEQLLEEIKQHKTKNQPKERNLPTSQMVTGK